MPQEDFSPDEDDPLTLTVFFPGMTERLLNEWLDINVDTDVTQPLWDNDIIHSVLNEEDKGEVDSDNETNGPADE